MSTITLAPQVRYQPRSSVRLTRRGRLVVFAFGVLLAFALGVWFAAGSVATQEAGVEQVEVADDVSIRPRPAARAIRHPDQSVGIRSSWPA